MSTGRLHRMRVIAREEYRRALDSRWLLGFAAAFAAIVLALSWFGLAPGGEAGFQGFARVTLSLLDLVLFLVPLVGLMLGVMSIAGSAESLALLLAQPVGRGEVLFGKFLGLSAALGVAQALGLGGGGLVIALQAGADQIRGYVVLCAMAWILGVSSVAMALCLAALWPDRLRATGAALGLWLIMVVVYDLVVFGLSATLRGMPLQAALVPAMLANPVDLTRVLTTLAVGSGALFGPTSAALMRTFGAPLGVTLAAGALALEALVPLLVAARAFRRRDW